MQSYNLLHLWGLGPGMGCQWWTPCLLSQSLFPSVPPSCPRFPWSLKLYTLEGIRGDFSGYKGRFLLTGMLIVAGWCVKATCFMCACPSLRGVSTFWSHNLEGGYQHLGNGEEVPVTIQLKTSEPSNSYLTVSVARVPTKATEGLGQLCPNLTAFKPKHVMFQDRS